MNHCVVGYGKAIVRSLFPLPRCTSFRFRFPTENLRRQRIAKQGFFSQTLWTIPQDPKIHLAASHPYILIGNVYCIQFVSKNIPNRHSRRQETFLRAPDRACPFRRLGPVESFQHACRIFHQLVTEEFRAVCRERAKPLVEGLSEDLGGSFSGKNSTPPVEFRNTFHPPGASLRSGKRKKEPGPRERAELFSQAIRPRGGKAGG